jgi:hypothetical protein
MSTELFSIKPYVGALPVAFGMRTDDVIALLGEPVRRSTNFRRQMTYDYDYVNIGFDLKLTVVHVGFVPGANVEFEHQSVFLRETFEKLVKLDAEAKELVGFVVLLKLGIAFTGFHDEDQSQRSISVFVAGAYDELIPKMKFFSV